MEVNLTNILHMPNYKTGRDMFYATLHIQNLDSGIAYDYGEGEGIHCLNKGEDGLSRISKADLFYKKHPPIEAHVAGVDYSFPMNLAAKIGIVLTEHLLNEKIRYLQEVEKHMQEYLIIGIPNQSQVKHNLPLPLRDDKELVELLELFSPELINGNIILNQNIPEKLLKEAGLNPNQYSEHIATYPEIHYSPRARSR